MKINLGSGTARYDGFVNLDSYAGCKPDVVIDINTQDIPFKDNTITEVKAYHILEHIGTGFMNLISELYRVCQDGAIIDVKVPHHRHDYFTGDPTHVRPITVEMMSKFQKSSSEFGTVSFAERLCVDFEIFDVNYILEDWFRESCTYLSKEQINLHARIYNNCIKELHFKMRVIK